MTADNKLNKHSSRSHSVLQMKLMIEDTNTQTNRRTIKNSLVNIVDLAGSEGASKTNAHGIRQREGHNINRSLLALSNVIVKLSEQNNLMRNRGGNNYHINFRDSKLTRILQTSLLGKSQAAIICCISQISSNVAETIQTL
jgi:centromeric protein E